MTMTATGILTPPFTRKERLMSDHAEIALPLRQGSEHGGSMTYVYDANNEMFCDCFTERDAAALVILVNRLTALAAQRDGERDAELAELRKDAERWRFLVNDVSTQWLAVHAASFHMVGKLSEAIDAAIAAGKGGGE
jgi:hypothetical protein